MVVDEKDWVGVRLRERKTSNSVNGKIRVFELCLVWYLLFLLLPGKQTNKVYDKYFVWKVNFIV
jgi:hypothetical protein